MTYARREDAYFTLVIGIALAARAMGPLRALLIEGLGSAACRLSAPKRKRIRAALQRALGDALSTEGERQATRGAFVSFWREMLEWRPAREQVSVHGLGHLRASVERGRGTILWVSHGFGLRSVAGELLHAEGFAIHQVHGPRHVWGLRVRHDGSWLRRRVVLPFFHRRERRWSAEILDLPGDGSLAFTRTLEARLRANRVLCVAGDGSEGHGHVTLPFLGTRERFATGMASLARATGATVLPLFCHLDELGRCRLVIEPPIDVAGGDRELAREGALAQYAALLDGYIRRYPDQYRTWHILSPETAAH